MGGAEGHLQERDEGLTENAGEKLFLAVPLNHFGDSNLVIFETALEAKGSSQLNLGCLVAVEAARAGGMPCNR